MNVGILDILKKKYGLELMNNQAIKDKPQQMTEVNKLRFQNVTYTAAKSIFESWRRMRSIKSEIEEKMKSYDEEVSEEKREKLSADIAILMSKYKFLKTNKGESPEIISRRAIRLNQGMIDNANGRVSAILKELDREAKKEKLTSKNVGTISEEEREELESEIEKVKAKQEAKETLGESDNDELAQEEIISEVGEEDRQKDDDSSGINEAEEVDLDVEEKKNPTLVIPVEDIKKYNEQSGKDSNKDKSKIILKVPLVAAEKISKREKDPEDKKEIIRIPLEKVEEYKNSKADKGVIAQGMTDEEIEASRKLLEETAPKSKGRTITFESKVPRERNEGETTREYGRYLDEFYKNLREDYYRSISGKKEDEPKEDERSKKTNYRDEINRLKEMAASLREQVDATKEAKRQANKSVEEAKKAADERRRKEEDEVKKAQDERAKAEELRKKKQEAMETVIEQFKAYLEGMKQEIEETQEDIKNAKAEELEIRDASKKESAKNEEKKAEAYRGRDEANETISSQEAYIQEMLSSMDKEEKADYKKNSK